LNKYLLLRNKYKHNKNKYTLSGGGVPGGVNALSSLDEATKN